MAGQLKYSPLQKHVTPRPDQWALEAQGRLLALAKRQGYPAVAEDVKRGTIQGFSRQSRMRLLKLINRCDWKQFKRSVFFHLTYPDDAWERSLGLVPNHVDLIRKRMEYHLGKQVSWLWKVEWKHRQSGARIGELAPHVHLLPCGVSYYPILKLRDQWADTIGTAEIPNVEYTYRYKAEYAARYAAKYAAKADESGLGASTYSETAVGRPWGWTRRHLLRWCRRRYTVGVTEAMIEAAREVYGLEVGEVPLGGFTLFIDEAERVFKRIIRTGWKEGGQATG